MSKIDNIAGNDPESVRVFSDLQQLDKVSLETMTMAGTAAGAVGKCTLLAVRQAMASPIRAEDQGFPTADAVYNALQPGEEHRLDTTVHITAQEREAWNGKETPDSVDTKIAAVLRSAKEYADQQKQILSDAFDVKLAAAVVELKDHVQTVVGALVDNAPEALNTLQELSAALGDNPNFATDIAEALGQRVTVEALAAELAKYVPRTGDTAIAGTLTATDFKITE